MPYRAGVFGFDGRKNFRLIPMLVPQAKEILQMFSTAKLFDFF